MVTSERIYRCQYAFRTTICRYLMNLSGPIFRAVLASDCRQSFFLSNRTFFFSLPIPAILRHRKQILTLTVHVLNVQTQKWQNLPPRHEIVSGGKANEIISGGKINLGNVKLTANHNSVSQNGTSLISHSSFTPYYFWCILHKKCFENEKDVKMYHKVL